MVAPDRPKLYYICHVDRLPSIVASGGLLSDAAVQQHNLAGTVIGMDNIKQRRPVYTQAAHALPAAGHRPPVEIRPDWYY